jgi:hypothetical protein
MADKIVSADGHMDLFYLPADTFTSRAPAQMRERVPHVVDVGGKPTWIGAGKLFIDFILSQEGQRSIQTVALRYPVRPDVELSGALLKLKGIRFWDSNWDAVFRNIDGHQKAFRQTFGFS